jgi:hypothetical protein
MIIALVFIYVLSCVFMYFEIRYLYFHDWKDKNPEGADIPIMFFPFLNTFVALLLLIVIIWRTFDKNLNKFFKVPKR